MLALRKAQKDNFSMISLAIILTTTANHGIDALSALLKIVLKC
jgi:hypothetical protein